MLQGQDTIVYDSKLDRVPWALGRVHRKPYNILSMRYCASLLLLAIGHSFNTVMSSYLISFKVSIGSIQSSMLSFFLLFG